MRNIIWPELVVKNLASRIIPTQNQIAPTQNNSFMMLSMYNTFYFNIIKNNHIVQSFRPLFLPYQYYFYFFVHFIVNCFSFNYTFDFLSNRTRHYNCCFYIFIPPLATDLIYLYTYIPVTTNVVPLNVASVNNHFFVSLYHIHFISATSHAT